MKSSKKKIGTVTSDKMDKTVVVEILNLREHPLYRKKYKQTKNIKACDPKNEYKNGDIVEIVETRPISKDKAWKVTRKI